MGEVVWLMCLVYRVGRSVAVADVPLSPLSLGGREATLTDCLTTALLLDDLLGVGCHDGGHVEFGFVHALIIGDLVGSGGKGGQFRHRTPDQRWRQ